MVLAANGPTFCAGHDLKEITQRRRDPDGGRAYVEDLMQRCSEMMQSIHRMPQPVVAAVEGAARRGAVLVDRAAARGEVDAAIAGAREELGPLGIARDHALGDVLLGQVDDEAAADRLAQVHELAARDVGALDRVLVEDG